MYFKVKASLFIAALFLLSSCKWLPGSNLSINEKNPPTGVVGVDLSRFNCLRDLGDSVNKYLNSDLNEAEIVDLAKCIRSALERFEVLTKDSSDGTYTPNSLIRFFNQEYLHEQKISSSFGVELMAVKSLVLGGSDERISRADLHELSSVVSFIEEHAIAHLPYIKIYRRSGIEHTEEVPKKDLLNAREQVRTSLRSAVGILTKNKQPYSLSSMGRLLSEIRLFLKWDETHPNALNLTQIMDIVRALKEIVSGDESDTIKSSDWSGISDAVSVAYGLLLNHDVSMRGQILTVNPALETFVESIQDGFSLLERIIQIQPESVIRFKQMDKLLTAFSRAKLLPEGIREVSISSIYKHLISHAFQNPLKPKSQKIQGLGLSELNEINAEFNLWASAQKYLSDKASNAYGLVFKTEDEVHARAIDLMNTFNFSKSILSGVRIAEEPNHEISLIVQHLNPFFKNGDERAYLTYPDELEKHGVQHNLFNLTRMNLMRALVRVMIRSFAEKDRVLTMAGITETEMEKVYQVIKPLGEDLKFMEPNRYNGVGSAGKGKKYFTEGNVFTQSGNGISALENDKEDLLSFYETVELLSMMWSGGQIRDELYSSIAKKCDDEGYDSSPLDIFKIRKINRLCFLQHFSDNHFEEFANLPNMKSSILNLNKQKKSKFVRDLQAIAKISCEDPRYIEKSELATISTVLHYVESLFTIYDVNKNGILNSLEVMQAFSRFSGYLSRQVYAAHGSVYSVSMLKAIYVLMIKEQRLPDGIGDMTKIMWYKMRYFNNDPDQFNDPDSFISNKSLPEISADRFAILKVLRVLTETARLTNEQSLSCAKK